MKNISIWAKAHPTASRILIAFSHVFIVINSLIIGSIVFAFNVGELKWSLVVFANIFFILYVTYPQKGAKVVVFRYSYWRRKFYDFSLVILYSSVIACGVNNILTHADWETYSSAQSTLTFISYRSESPKRLLPEQTLHTKKSIRENIRNKARVLAKYLKEPAGNSKGTGAKVLLFFLSFGLVLLLGYGVALLACNIACSGAEGLAWVVLILGWGGIVWLEIIALRGIGKLYLRKKTSSPAEKPL